MTVSDWITLVGVGVTILSMGVSINQAMSARNSSRSAKRVMDAVQLAANAERLKSAQEHIRDVAPEKVALRGFKIGNRFDLIRREFDYSLSSLPKKGIGGEAREQLVQAQTELNSYEASLKSNPDVETWQKLQALLQDAISDLLSRNPNSGE